MRLLLSLTALAVVTLADTTGALDRVLRSWDMSKPVEVVAARGNDSKYTIPYEDDFMVLANQPCLPGYTGDTCTNPICTSENTKVPNVPAIGGTTANVDAAILSNCQQSYALLIDETMSNVRVKLASDLIVNPRFKLQDWNGNTVQEDDIWEETPQLIDMLYFYLPPGIYTVVPAADAPVNCYLQVAAHTTMTVVGGFISGDRIYSERSDQPSTVVYTGTRSSVVVHANNNRSPGALKTIKFMGTQNTYYPPNDLRVRYQCGYEYIWWGFECSVLGDHYFQVEGVTHAGYGFRRIVTFDCLNDYTNATTPASTPATNPKVCHNGGMRVNNLDGSSYCYCLGLWTGNDCSKILCLNGGTQNADNTCQCLDGFNGFHCEQVFCMDISGFGFNADHPTLTFVIRGRQQMNSVVSQVQQAATAYLSNMQFDPNYFNNFILVLFNNNQIIKSGRYIDILDLVNDISSYAKNFTSDGDCTDSVFSAISQALNLFPHNKSPMYVFTDAPPSDSAQIETLIHQLSYWRVPINIVYTPTSPATCPTKVDDPNFWEMDNLAKKSMGAVFSLRNQTQVFDFTYDHLWSTGYRSQLMLSNDDDTCAGQNPYQAVAIESLVDSLTIVATGSNLSLNLTAPETNIAPISVDPYYSDGVNYIWSFNRVTTGTWLININSASSNGPCYYKVYQKSFHGSKNVQYDMFWAFTGAIDSDGPTQQPLFGLDLSISVHLNNYPDFIPPQYVQSALNIYATRNGKQVELYASNGVWRDGCSYNFYFPEFSCPVADETLYFNFYARDELGLPIQRAGVMNCMVYVPTITPPNGCLNGGIPNTDNSTCYCPMGFSGPHCEKLTCFNGGTPIANSTQCRCSNSWTGPFCEIAKCIERGPDPEILMGSVDMVFAVELTLTGQAQIAYLNKNFAELIRDINSQSRTWIRNFVIVGYNSTWGDVMHVTPAGNPEGIIHAMEQIASKDYTDNACTVQLYRALNRAVIRGTTPPGSFIEIFTVTPADQSANGGWSEMYESMRTLYLNVYGYLNIVNPSARNPTGLACNSTYNDYQLLFDLAGGSAGKVYPTQAAMIQDIVKVIPLQYMSSMVYGQVKTDCTEPMQVYFPIDAYTQTILLSVVGNNTKINIYDAQSRSVEYFQFHHDTVSLWDLYEIRKPCDTDWIEVGQYCTYFGKQPKSYDDAHVFCSQAGGFVVDDLTPDKHRFLSENANSMKFWIGLTNMNNNGYVWDRGYNYTQNLNQTNVYWVGGQTPTYDSGKQCVFFNSSAQDQYTWTPDDCATQRPFVCQKHRYDADSPPTDLNSNHLSAGMWYVNITTDSPPGISGVPGCYAEVRIQSKLMIYTGFVTNPAMDFPANDPINSSPENQIIAYIHSEDHDSSTPILKYATLWDAYNGSFYNAMQYQYRVECSFSWISQTFPCPNANSPMNEFGIAHIGEDEFGNMFQRITLAHCTSPVLTCGNGGYRYNGTCVCDEYWTGLFCTIPICVNGGTLSRNDQFCECPTGYAGPNCQFDECRRAVPVSFSPDNRTLILVLEATVQNKPAFTQLANSMAAIIFNASPGWFKNYALITFDSSGVVYDAYTYTSPQSFQTAIAIQQNVISDPGACQYNLFAILKQALMQVDMIVTPNSQVLMITSSTAADSATRTETIERLSNEEASLHWLYMSNDNCGGAVPSDDSVPHLVKLAYASNGNTAFVKSNNLTDFLTPYLASRYSAQILDNPTANPSNGAAPLTCPSGSWLVEVDMNTTSIFITANSAIGTVGVIAPNGDSINPVTLFNGAEQTQLYRIDTMGSSGIYKIALSSPGMCFLSVWGVGSMGVYTRFAPTSATDLTAAHLDGTATSPSANVNSVAMFHMAGTPGHRGILQYLEVFDVSTQTTILRSELYRRSSCSFEYYSDPFTCQMDIITLYIYGMDESYQPFRRQQMSFCLNGTLSTASPVTVSSTQSLGTTSTTAPATVPSGGTSGPTTTMGSTTTSFGYLNLVFDVVFLVDVSNSANSTYDTMSQFITNLMAGYTVSQNNVRVAIIPVPGKSNPATFAVATLKTITSSNMLTQYLSETKTSFNDFTDAGQSLQSALNQAIKPDFMQKGYRADQPNHLLVYVTSTSTFTDGPSTASILSANNYGIITVGYGAGLDKGALQGISGGSACTFTAATAGDLQSQIPSIKKLIWSANFNGGAYCGNMPASTTQTPAGNPNLIFDVVFMIDVSQANVNNYDILSNFIQTLMLSYTVAQDNVRVGILPVMPEPSGIPWARLNTITSQQVLVSYLNQLKQTIVDIGMFTEVGQYVQPALDQATSYNFMINGYRGNIKNHLLIYLTSTTTFSDTPTTDTIRASKQYGVITVGYGAGATDKNGLQGLSGGGNCAFTAADQNSLNRDVLNSIQNLIWSSDGNGIYCGM